VDGETASVVTLDPAIVRWAWQVLINHARTTLRASGPPSADTDAAGAFWVAAQSSRLPTGFAYPTLLLEFDDA
jgi:hypothetical protein